MSSSTANVSRKRCGLKSATPALRATALSRCLQNFVAVAKLLGDPDEVGDATAEPVEAPDEEGVAGAEGVEEAVELGTLAGVATDVFGVDTLAAGVPQCVDLQPRILIDGGDSVVTNFHGAVTLQLFSTAIVSPEC